MFVFKIGGYASSISSECNQWGETNQVDVELDTSFNVGMNWLYMCIVLNYVHV